MMHFLKKRITFIIENDYLYFDGISDILNTFDEDGGQVPVSASIISLVFKVSIMSSKF